jgi:CBS domain-containing protein
MNAREVMTSPVISATADTPVRDIAQLLLQNHVSAIPVLDNSGAPIGMVSEGDLIGRDETERSAHRDWWLALRAEGDSRSSDFLSSLSRSELVASDIMSRPVVTVGENTDSAEIADLLAEYRIKRVPVVRDGQVVGIVTVPRAPKSLIITRKALDVDGQNLRPSGRPKNADNGHCDVNGSRPTGNSDTAPLRRLERQRPDLPDRVLAGELSSATLAAGFRRHRALSADAGCTAIARRSS